jgi:hypothetical protein
MREKIEFLMNWKIIGELSDWHKNGLWEREERVEGDG